MSKNLGWAFYKDYYRGMKILANKEIQLAKSFSECNRVFLTQRLADMHEAKKVLEQSMPAANVCLKLCTLYPGMLMGTGYAHGIKEEGEFKIGFYFDHVTGMPILPGSSVKGSLRQAFTPQARTYLQTLLREILNNEAFELTESLRSTLALHIFGPENNDPGPKPLSVYQQDVFLDAFPINTRDSRGYFLGSDSITPHSNPLQNPIPLLFLKVLPQVTFWFGFRLNPTRIELENHAVFELDIKQKKELFRQILYDLGVGAKTNVGYGQFDPTLEEVCGEEAIVVAPEFYNGIIEQDASVELDAVITSENKPYRADYYLTEGKIVNFKVGEVPLGVNLEKGIVVRISLKFLNGNPVFPLFKSIKK